MIQIFVGFLVILLSCIIKIHQQGKKHKGKDQYQWKGLAEYANWVGVHLLFSGTVIAISGISKQMGYNKWISFIILCIGLMIGTRGLAERKRL